MSSYQELAEFRPSLPSIEKESVDQKIEQSKQLLAQIADPDIMAEITEESFVLGEVPRLSPFDMPLLPEGTRLVRVPEELSEQLAQESSQDRIDWNQPDDVLTRLAKKDTPFKHPVPGNSVVMDRLNHEKTAVAFADLKVKSPKANGSRHSRTEIDANLENNHVIMGRCVIPIAMGAMPDVSSPLAHILVAQSNAITFISRDKVLGDIKHQVDVADRVISFLRTVTLPQEILPNEAQLQRFWQIMKREPNQFDSEKAMKDYIKELREAWIANVGVAIEASPSGLERAEANYGKGVRLFRVYSPEGGIEVVNQTKKLRRLFGSKVKIVSGQIIDEETGINAVDLGIAAIEEAGADSLMLGVAGGRQCTTSKISGIPVDTPNILYGLRGRVNVPIGIEGGGVGDNLMQAFALGASYVCKPGEIGLSIEGAGGRYMMVDKDGNILELYTGEAAISSKWWRDLKDRQGRPRNREGEPNVVILPQDNYSITRNITRLRQAAATSISFQRAFTVTEIQQRNLSMDNSEIWKVSEASAGLSGAYGT